DLTIALDRDLPRVKAEFTQQVAHGPSDRQRARFPVEYDRRHGWEGTRFGPAWASQSKTGSAPYARCAPNSVNPDSQRGAHHNSQWPPAITCIVHATDDRPGTSLRAN